MPDKGLCLECILFHANAKPIFECWLLIGFGRHGKGLEVPWKWDQIKVQEPKDKALPRYKKNELEVDMTEKPRLKWCQLPYVKWIPISGQHLHANLFNLGDAARQGIHDRTTAWKRFSWSMVPLGSCRTFPSIRELFWCMWRTFQRSRECSLEAILWSSVRRFPNNDWIHDRESEPCERLEVDSWAFPIHSKALTQRI